MYSYAIYLTGVPMNRVFLVYVVLESVGRRGPARRSVAAGHDAVAATAPERLRRGTGLDARGGGRAVRRPVALHAAAGRATGAPPDPEGVGGTAYPVFVLDLVVVLPSVAAVGVLLLRRHRLGPPLALVALIKIITLFAALWAGPAYALATDGPVDLGPDAVPSLLLLAASGWLAHPLVRTYPAEDRRAAMNTLVVYESMWGNTRAVAEAVAEELGEDVTLVDVNDAPAPLPDDIDLLVVGGPTHAFSMSRASTRRDAVTKGATAGRASARHPRVARHLPAGHDVDVATFDTRVGHGPPPARLRGQGGRQAGTPPPPRAAGRRGELLRRGHGGPPARRGARPGLGVGRVTGPDRAGPHLEGVPGPPTPCDARGRDQDRPAPEHRRPEGVTDATVEALGKLSAALDHIEDARGHIYAFHRLMGSAETTLEEATAMIRDAGHDDIADALNDGMLGRNPLPGMWSFQMVEAFDDGYYAEAKGIQQRAIDELMDGRRHVFEAEMKELRRTRDRVGHEAVPDDADGTF